MPLVPDDGFQNESRNRVRTFELHRLFDHGQRGFRGLPAALDAVIRIEHAHHAGNSRFRRPAPRIAGERRCCPRSRRDTSGSAP